MSLRTIMALCSKRRPEFVSLSTFYSKVRLIAVEQQRKEFTSVSETEHIKLFVQILEDKL